MLNATDGILGEMMDLRILSTTNASHNEIEPALLRTGRVSAHVEVGQLSPEEAQNAYASLKGAKPCAITEKVTLAEIYALARDNGWDPSASKDLFKSKDVLAELADD